MNWPYASAPLALLPPDRIVVEILETVNPTDEILDHLPRTALLRLSPGSRRFRRTSPSSSRSSNSSNSSKSISSCSIPRAANPHRQDITTANLALLAEKVETEQDLAEARHLGFSYFQGYFFCKPSMIETREIPGNKLIQLELLNAVAAPELDYSAIEELLKRETFPALPPPRAI